MNLGNMLAAGKCFINGRAAAAYRENKNVYLPKFNSEKNPFLPKQAEANSAAAAGSARVGIFGRTVNGPMKIRSVQFRSQTGDGGGGAGRAEAAPERSL